MDAAPGADRPGRLAHERVPHARRQALLRRHLLPRQPRHGMPAFRQLLARIAEVWADRREWIEPTATKLAERVREEQDAPARLMAALARAPGGRPRRSARRRHDVACSSPSIRSTAAAARRPSSRRRCRSSCLLREHLRTGARSRAWWPSARSTPWPPAASTTSSAAASRATAPTPAGSCRTSRRCSTTTRCWPASTPTRPSSPATRVYADVARETLDFVAHEMRDPTRRRLRSLARRRQRGRGRRHVHLGRGRGARGPGRRRAAASRPPTA